MSFLNKKKANCCDIREIKHHPVADYFHTSASILGVFKMKIWTVFN